jgi:hypothetical protein
MTRINAYHPDGHIRGVDVLPGTDPAKALRVLREMVKGWPAFRLVARTA